MKIPFSWLKELVDIDISAQELEEKLFSCGFEVEERIDLAASVKGVVVGEITSFAKQEGTSHLNLCVVDCGPEYGHDIRITTGAPNIFAGARVPVALDGAVLPGGIRIAKRMMQGVESNGMLCSGAELGINDDWYPGAEVNGLLILDKDTPLGAGIAGVVGLDDVIFDISITANRPDCQSVLGMAREVAALLHKPLRLPATDFTCTGAPDDSISVRVEAPDLCPRYLAHYVRDLKIAESPRWMKRHLALMGLRSISNVVDITNHTLLEIGQPMHAFDLAKVEGRSIVVRRAREGERIVTLDEKDLALTPANLVICDAEKPVALAGVMGGLNSGIGPDSKELLFEAATFARDSVRKTSRALGKSSDSSSRFEKGVDQYSTEFGLARSLHLIQELGCGDITPTAFDCAAADTSARRMITVTPAQINKVLGIEVPGEVMIDILTRLDFGVMQQGGVWEVSVPRYRDDVEGYPDLAEEVIREYGYSHINPAFLASAQVTKGGFSAGQLLDLKLKRLFAAQGFYEASTLAFYSVADLDRLHLAPTAPERQAIRILNPISEHLSIMRTLLAPSMLNIVVDNLKKGNTEGRLFELSNVYLPHSLPLAELPEERLSLAFAAFGPDEDFFAMKGVLETVAEHYGCALAFRRETETPWLHPGIAASVWCEGVRVGVFGKLANEITAELDIARDEKQSQNIYLGEMDYAAWKGFFASERRYCPLPAVAPVQRDLALVCPEGLACGDIQACIAGASSLVQREELFDVYRGANLGEGKKSMAFTLSFADKAGKELPAERVEQEMKKILSDLSQKLGVEMR